MLNIVLIEQEIPPNTGNITPVRQHRILPALAAPIDFQLDERRSMNLANAVAVASGEAWRQPDFRGAR